MKTRLLVDGDTERIVNFVKLLMFVDYPISIYVVDPEANKQIKGLHCDVLCNYFETDATQNIDDYHNIDGMVYLYPFPDDALDESDSIANFLSAYVDEFRKSINNAINMEFDGDIIINGFNDEILAYFAAKFSGKDESKIIATGTLSKTILLKNALRKYFSVSLSDINVSVLGNETHNVISWSRSYIGQSPILSYLASSNSLFNNKVFDQTEQLINGDTIHDDILQFKALLKILDALYMGKSCLISLAHVIIKNGVVSVVSEPIMLSNKGVIQTVKLVLSDQEQHVVELAEQQNMEIIDKIIKDNQ